MIEYYSLGEITKADRRDDGTVEFHAAKAAGPDLDLDQQILDPDWLRSAMPAWFQTGGNLREQHIPTSAAGVATNLTTTDTGDHLIDGLVVDPVTARKVDLGVLKGLSVGIKAPRIIKDAAAPGGRVVGGSIVEVSLVDRPCNPTCKMALAKTVSGELADVAEPEIEQLDKRDFSNSERAEAASNGQAMPGGGFPIANVGDLRNAIRAIGRAKNPAAAKAHIKTRAAALGATDLIPASWKAEQPDDTKTDDTWTHDPAELAAVRDGIARLMQAELDELMSGEDELCDLSELLCSLQYFLCWWNSEAADGEDPTPEAVADAAHQEDDMTPITLGVVAELVKNASAEDAPEDTRSQLADLIKALGALTPDDLKAALDSARDEIADTVKTALDAAKAEHAQHDDDVVARLAKVEEMAAPGGPARTRPAEAAAKAAAADAKRLEAQYLREQAATVDDRVLAAGYRAKAAALDAEITDLG